jgi:isoleucyl-tRNA synthetase
LAADQVVTADGSTRFVEAIKEFDAGHIKARLLEVLACTGCIMGPGFSADSPHFQRRSNVSAYVRESLAERAPGAKCPRCWNYRETVGTSTEHPSLCGRCAAALDGRA